MNILPLPAIDGVAAVDWELAGNVSANLSTARTMQREVLDGDQWVAQLRFPPTIDEEAGIIDAWQAQARRGDRWLYLSPPQNKLRGAWTLTDLVSNGTFLGGATTGWTGTGATLSVNARRLKVKNSGAAIGYARQTLTVTADVPYVLLVDLYPGSTENWRIRLLDGADVEEHVSYYNVAGRVPIVHIPSSTTIKVELGCNTAVSGDDVKFGNVTAARCLLVKDSLAVGNKLTVKGGPASTDAAIKAGQFVTIRLWNGWQMVKLVEDFDTDSAGEGTLRFEPALRDGVLGGGPVIVHQPFARMVFSDPRAVASVRPPYIHESGIGVMEDVTPLDGEVPQDTDLIWGWFADSLSLVPTVGSGTPTLTADIDNWYFDSDGIMKQVAAANTAVFEFNPITKALKGQRIQSARTNLVWPSDDFSHANWVKTIGGTGSNPVIVANDAVAPDGTTTADKITLNRGSGDTSSDISSLDFGTGTTSSGVAHAGTVFLKGIAGQIVAIRHAGGAGYTLHTFTGAWDRFESIETSGSTTPIFQLADRGTFGSTRNVTFWAWRAQLEVGPFASSPIQTLTGTVARAADVDAIALNLIPGFPTSEYTVVGEALLDVVEASAATGRHVLTLDDGTTNETTLEDFHQGTSSRLDTAVIDGGAQQESFGGNNATAGVPMRYGHGVKANDFGFSIDGGATQVDSAGTMPTVTTMRKGTDTAGAEFLNGYLRRLSIYKKKKPNRQIRSLSA